MPVITASIIQASGRRGVLTIETGVDVPDATLRTRAQQSALAAQLKAQADAELASMRDKARSEIESAKKQALAEIYAESVNLGTIIAGKILQREVTASDQQRLMDESLAEMKAVNA